MQDALRRVETLLKGVPVRSIMLAKMTEVPCTIPGAARMGKI